MKSAALMALGQAALEARGAGLWERIDARALDLSRTDPDQEGLFWMTRHRVVAEAQGVDDVYLLKSVAVPLGDPTASVIGLGAERLSLYDRLARSAL